MARLIATKADLYGPSSGFTFNESASIQTPASDPGGGSSGSIQSGTVAVPATQILQGWQGSILAQPVTWLFGLVLFLVAWKLIEEREGSKTRERVGEVKVGAGNLLKTTVLVMIGFAIAKYFARTVQVPGVSPFIMYATGAS